MNCSRFKSGQRTSGLAALMLRRVRGVDGQQVAPLKFAGGKTPPASPTVRAGFHSPIPRWGFDPWNSSHLVAFPGKAGPESGVRIARAVERRSGGRSGNPPTGSFSETGRRPAASPEITGGGSGRADVRRLGSWLLGDRELLSATAAWGRALPRDRPLRKVRGSQAWRLQLRVAAKA